MHWPADELTHVGRQKRPAANNCITQLRSEWQGTGQVVGSHAMRASAKKRADGAQYDNPLRGASLHTEGPPAGLADAGNLSLAFQSWDGRRACDEGGQ
jgi:hypothetical protein